MVARKDAHEHEREGQGRLREQELCSESHATSSLGRNDVDVEAARLADQASGAACARAPAASPPGSERPTTMWPTLCERANSRIACDGVGRLQAHDLGAELARQVAVGHEVALGLGVDPVRRLARRLDEHHEPVGAQPAGEPRALAHQDRAARRSRRQADHDPRRGGWRGRRSGSAPRGSGRRALARSTLSATSRSASSRRCAEVLVLEEVLERPADLVRAVDLSGAQPLLQILDGQVEVDHLVGLLQEAVGHRLADGDAGDALDDVLEALEVLDVEGADDVDAGVEQLDDVLVALAVAAARERSCAPARRRW